MPTELASSLPRTVTAAMAPNYAYWDVFSDKLVSVLVGSLLAIGVWLVWTMIATVVLKRYLDRDDPQVRSWMMVTSGLLGIASALYFGLVLMAP